MESLLINNDFVHRHPLWDRCSATLQDISERDYPGDAYFHEIKTVDALDLDSYEHSLHRSTTECTGDATVGIALSKEGEDLKHPSLMLVELRMGYKNGDNLEIQTIKKKIEHSTGLLNESGACRIHPNYYFVFTDTEAPRAKNKLSRDANEIGRMKNYIVVSVSEFQNMMVDPDTLPYEPKHKKEDIEHSFVSRQTNNDAFDMSAFMTEYDDWFDKVRKYRYQYQLLESRHIASVLKDIAVDIRKQAYISAEDKELLDVIEEELMPYLD